MNTATAEVTTLELVEHPLQANLPARTNTALTEVSAGPLAMAMQAMKAGMSIADMRAMLELQKDWEANEARKAYVAAMAEFKRDPPEIFKRKQVEFTTRDGDTTSYKHATLGDVTTAIINGLAQHGISHRWDTKQDGGRIVVTCILTHALGHSESTSLEGAPDASGKKNGIQQVASTITYLQRYTLLGASGLATKDAEDDDGAGATPPPAVPEQLLEQAREAALGGWKALAAWIKARTQEERTALEPASASLKAAAKAADQRGAKQ
jgi:hypothetical protein